MRKIVLKVPLNVLSGEEVTDQISSWTMEESAMKIVVTAYSEFYVRAQSDTEFMKVMQSADLVTPDGVSVLAAALYLDNAKGKSIINRFGEGMKVGGKILAGKVGKPVTGVWLFENLTKLAAEKGWRVFLLGGWEDVSEKTARMLLKRFPKLEIEFDAGEERVGTDEVTNKRVIEKINKFSPDLLFVSYNPIKQEKWLTKYKDELKVKVGMGVGGTFNEYVGKLKMAPLWMEKMGLKWLWRVFIEPKRFGRIMRAVIVFPWLVFRSKD